jgi:tetratricopeptide (TPR) repeat protein
VTLRSLPVAAAGPPALIPDALRPQIGLGDRLLARGHFEGAAGCYRRVLRSCPAHADTRIKLAHTLKLAGNFPEAAGILDGLAADYPDNPAVAKEFGRLYFAQHKLDEALERFYHAVRLNPEDADTHHWLANLETMKGNAAVAHTHYRRCVELDPLMRVPAIKSPPDFSVLFLFAPGGANTPPDALVKLAPYESCFLLVLPDAEYDHARLRNSVQLVVNLISDADLGREVVLVAAALADRIGLPVVNHPRAILATDRQMVADRLSGIPSCRVPRVRRLDTEVERAAQAEDEFPLLLRVAGTHGGESFEKIESATAFEAFAARHPRSSLYVTEFLDCRSADGFFRKYRFFFVGDRIYPYHLAIHDTWKVHHGTTDMASQPWMQAEEAAFLNDPAQFFGPRPFAALETIRQTIGLDFFGIDCAIDRDGKLVVFEVNATMLMHGPDGIFAYKVAAADAIKHAFDAMLATIALATPTAFPAAAVPVPRPLPPLAPEVAALLRQASALRRAGNPEGMVALLEQAAQMAPDNAALLHDLGLALLNAGKPAPALPYLDRAVTLDPGLGQAHMLRGVALEATAQPGAASAYERAIASAPDLAEAYGRLASLHLRRGQRTEAASLYREAAQRAGDEPDQRTYRARAALLEQDLDAAETSLRQALAIHANAPAALALLASVQTARGDFADAEANLTQSLRLQPAEIGLYYELVQTRKIRAGDAALIGRMRAALCREVPPRSKVRLHLALAKALDDIGDYQDAASQLETASDLQGRYFPIDRMALAAQVDRLIEVLTPDFLAHADHGRHPSEMPILVLGMPRSGTTLTEQILSSHPAVAAGGEVPFWQGVGLHFLPSYRSGPVSGWRTAEAYLARLGSVSPAAGRVVDKNPFNFMWAGVVHLLFPNARIVHCRRHPADTCLSALFADITHPQFSNAIDDLVFYYRQYRRVMEHYRGLLPADRFYELDYDRLVDDPATEIRSLIGFCGLPWDDACLAPEQNRRAVLTSSAWQARQPIYRSSSGRRRHYEALLRPFERLEG